MLVPVKWLREYVNLEGIDSRQIADELTMSGSHVDSIEYVDKGVENVVVGHILEITPHPDADKLQITKIDVGEEILQIVTGAQNVKVGQYVPVAKVGAKLPDGTKIKKGKLRGIESLGMLCSTDELGIPENVVEKGVRDGIYILDQAYPLGEDIRTVLGLTESVIDFEITPNRPDCLSILGMAREASATFNRDMQEPKKEISQEEGEITSFIEKITITNTEGCLRYIGKVIKDVKVMRSPLWMQRRLMEAGVRPINNIVDITNYVMLELGQPLHAFDYEKIKGKEIVVRNAVDGECFRTLDGVDRVLDGQTMLICDKENSLAIAGIMGGAESEVSKETKTIFLESAMFDSKLVRLSSRKLGLRTEASSRFEKGLDPNLAMDAIQRVCVLVELLGCGTVVGGIQDNYPNPLLPKTVILRPNKVQELLSVCIPKEEMKNSLERFGMNTKELGDNLEVVIPTYRQDVQAEVDLIEEVGRIYGFHNIEAAPYVAHIREGGKSDFRNAVDKAKQHLVGFGFNEITTYSFISPKTFSKLLLPETSMKRNCVKIQNPLGEDFSVMRTTLLGNMMEVLGKNYKKKVEQVQAFEIGSIFIPKGETGQGLPYEIRTLSMGAYGESSDFYGFKGYITALLERFGIVDLDFEPEKHHSTFHPGRTATILKENHVLGIMGEVHPKVCEQYGVKGRFYLAELDFELIFMLANNKRVFKELPKYPSIKRDLALITDQKMMAKQMEKVIRQNGGKLLVDVSLFDVYTGDQIEKGKKSVAYKLEYRASDRTLTDEEVDKATQKILEALSKELGVLLRA